MKAFLLTIGAAAARFLHPLLSSFSCVSAGVETLSLCTLSNREEDPVWAAYLQDLNRCHKLFEHFPDSGLFSCSYDWTFCRPALPALPLLTADEASETLVSALRGKGLPLSYQTDREAVEWSFSALLSQSEVPSLQPFYQWLSQLEAAGTGGGEVRLFLLAEACDACSAGLLMSLLPWLRQRLQALHPFIGIIATACFAPGAAGEQSPELAAALKAMEDRGFLRTTDERETRGADTLWLLALPSSFIRSEDSTRLLAGAAALLLKESLSKSAGRPAAGLHTRSLQGMLNLQALGAAAQPIAACLHTAVWWFADIGPALKSYLEHPVLLRSLAPSTRNGLFRRLFRSENDLPAVTAALRLLEKTLTGQLMDLLSLLRTLPDALRTAPENDSLWDEAVAACGRVVTLASEYDVSQAEAEASGIDRVKPVHRVSLADTEEEKALRRLDDLAEQLTEAKRSRAALLGKMGGYRSAQVLQDCLNKCRAALTAAQQKMHELTQEPDIDAFRLGKQERRIRLLQAAIARAENDLQEALTYPALSAVPAAPLSVTAPFAGELLHPASADALFRLLVREESEPAEPLEKALREQLPSLLPGSPLPDAKALLRSLLSVAPPASAAPFPCLYASMLRVSREETGRLRFLSAGKVPPLPLLPDILTTEPVISLGRLLASFPRVAGKDVSAENRGLLAFLLLRQYRRTAPGEAVLSLRRLLPEESAVVRLWCESRQAESVWVISLAAGELSLPFALILPGRALLPARLTQAHRNLMPSFVTWFDPESLSFRDPSDRLGESDRTILHQQLESLVRALPPSTLLTFLSDFAQSLAEKPAVSPEDPQFSARLKAALGLMQLPAYKDALQRNTAFYERALGTDQVAACLAGQSSFAASACDVPEETLYTWRGIPFARESAQLLLEEAHVPEEKVVLSSLETDCDILFRSSDEYRDGLTRRLNELLAKYPSAAADRLEQARSLLEAAVQPVTEKTTELVWPWDTASPAVRTLLEECLGTELASAAMNPFSQRLTVFPTRGREILGDAMLSELCNLPVEILQSAPEAPPPPTPAASTPETGQAPDGSPEADTVPAVASDALLPPLSPYLASVLCRLPEGRTLIQPSFLAFERRENSTLRVSLTLEGSFTLRLRRNYAPDEILPLYAHRMPTLAVWPSVPFPPEQWKCYYVYAHQPESFRISAWTQESADPVLLEGDTPRRVLSLPTFPVCFTLEIDGYTAGALPNLLPAPQLSAVGAMLACVDFGSAASSVVLQSAQGRMPLHGPVMVRTLLQHPAATAELLRREFLPAVPVSALLPTAVRLFRNVPGQAPLPLEDGIIWMAANLADLLSAPTDALYSSLKWEAEKGRSTMLYLHQLMLLTSLYARWNGATALSWRFAIPDEMAPEGRQRLAALFQSAASAVREESGLSFADRLPPVAFASESAALGAYFRFCAPEDTRGGFMVLDIGAGTADLSLFLRTRETAARAAQLHLGLRNMLLPTLLRHPNLLLSDFGLLPDDALQRELLQLQELLHRSRSDAASLRPLRIALDTLLADHLPLLLSYAAQRRSEGAPTITGSLLLLHTSYLLMLSGLLLLQLAADPSKNDFLPQQMTLCLAGRGAKVVEALSIPVKTSLWHFLTMFRNPRVASLALMFSTEKKLEIPVGLSALQDVSTGLPMSSSIPPAIAVRPEELLPEFLSRFLREFPGEAAMLFPGFYTGDFYHPFTPRGDALIASAIDSSFTETFANRPYDALAAWLENLLELIQS